MSFDDVQTFYYGLGLIKLHVNIPSLGEIQDNQIGSQLKAQNHEIKFDLKLKTTQFLQAGGTKLFD